jgi:hypothetical protein
MKVTIAPDFRDLFRLAPLDAATVRDCRMSARWC